MLTAGMPEASGYFAAIISFEEWKEKIGEIRYGTFVTLLRWVTGDPETGIEVDLYDEESIHIAIFSKKEKGKIVGYLRILPANSTCGLMLTGEECFKNMLPDGFAVQPRSIEVSRLCLAEEVRKSRIGLIVSELLFRSVLAFMGKNDFDLLYAIADTKDKRGHSHYDLLKKRFPLFTDIASKELKPGIRTCIMSITRAGVEEALEK